MTKTSRAANNIKKNYRDEINHPELMNALPHPVLVLDRDNCIVYANSAAETFFRTSVAVLQRQKLEDLIAFGSPLLALVDQVRRNNATVNEYGIELGNPRTGDDKLVDVFGGYMLDQQDRLIIMLQQRSMAQMIERQLTHRAAARTVSGMAAVLAHEIKNPLSGIRGAAQLLEGNLSDSDRALTQLICAETDRVCKLVDRMEVFGDERPILLEPVNIHDVLDRVKQISKSGFAKNIVLTQNYDPSLPSIPGHRDKLIQAFLNLVKNAAEAVGDDRSDGKIVITTAFQPGVRLSLPGSKARVSLPLEISIEDNGSGIPEELKPHLFDPFVTTKQQGTGLGLALVAKIIGDHGGIIECDSRPRRTIFRALMPMKDATSATQ